MFKFVHAADLHLDSPLRGLSLLEGAPEEQIRTATRRALENLVDLCITENVSFLIIAGDVYDGDWEDYQTGLFFNRCMARLKERSIPVYLIRGNHDAASQISRRLTLPDNVYEFSSDKPETKIIPSLNVAIHGQSFANRAVTENLALSYPAPEPWHFNIGILHTAAEGQEGHEPYAPCRVSDMVNKGYDYWALGHIHKRQVLCEEPYILFAGNIQGRHIRETGDKGCSLVTVDGKAVQVEHRSLDVLRWMVCEVDLTGSESFDDLSLKVTGSIATAADDNGGYPLAVRVMLSGFTKLHGALLEDEERVLREVQNAAVMAAGDRVWIEKVKLRTNPLQLPALAAQGDATAIAALTESVFSALEDEEFIGDFLSYAQTLQAKMREYTGAPEATVIRTKQDVETLLSDAREVLLTLALKGGASR